jgi:hypothetical protein
MPDTVTADDIDHIAAKLDVHLTDWQRTFLVDAYAHRNRTGRWPYLTFATRRGRSQLIKVAAALA